MPQCHSWSWLAEKDRIFNRREFLLIHIEQRSKRTLPMIERSTKLPPVMVYGEAEHVDVVKKSGVSVVLPVQPYNLSHRVIWIRPCWRIWWRIDGRSVCRTRDISVNRDIQCIRGVIGRKDNVHIERDKLQSAGVGRDNGIIETVVEFQAHCIRRCDQEAEEGDEKEEACRVIA